MISSTQITNAKIFPFIAVLDFKFLSRNRKDNRNNQKVGYFIKKIANFTGNCCKFINDWNAKFSGIF